MRNCLTKFTRIFEYRAVQKYLLAKFGVDTAENGPLKVCQKLATSEKFKKRFKKHRPPQFQPQTAAEPGRPAIGCGRRCVWARPSAQSGAEGAFELTCLLTAEFEILEEAPYFSNIAVNVKSPSWMFHANA